jgi:tellurium resistance protein TerZ
VRILGSHDKNELKLIADHYLEVYGQTLVEALNSELSGCFRKAAIAWVGVPDPLNLSALKTALASAAAATTTATAPPVLPSRSLPERPDTSSALNSTYTHNLQAGESTTVPTSSVMDRLKMGLGWDVTRGQAIDLDAGVIMLDSSANVINTVYFASKEAPGVRCGEDNRSGDQKGDDETIDIQLSAIPQHITTLVFTVHCYTAGASFASVNSAYARIIIPATGHVCALFKLDGNIRSQGVAFAM